MSEVRTRKPPATMASDRERAPSLTPTGRVLLADLARASERGECSDAVVDLVRHALPLIAAEACNDRR